MNTAKAIFQQKLPVPLREKPPQVAQDKSGQPAATDKKEEEPTSQVGEKNTTSKKEDNLEGGTSEVEQSEDEQKIDPIRQKEIEKELEQVIYISISETPTNILFYCPSTKYLTLKNGNYIYF